MSRTRTAWLVLLLFAPTPLILAQPRAPAPPATYDVLIRYQIDATRNDRVQQYGEMARFFKEAGFQRDPGEMVEDTEPEDPGATRMRGTIPAAKARSLLDEHHVQTIRLSPPGQKLPDDPATAVRVEFELPSRLPPDRQRLLYNQVRRVLGELGFKDALGYDHRQFTRLSGMLPAGQLETVFAGLWRQPAALAFLSRSLLASEPLTATAATLLAALLDQVLARPEYQKLLETLLTDLKRLPAPENEKESLESRISRGVTSLLVDLNLARQQGPALRDILAMLGQKPEARDFLDVFLNRLRRQRNSGLLPGFYRVTWPVAVTRMMPADMPPTAERPEPARIPPGQENLTPDLRELLKDQEMAKQPIRMEVILSRPPDDSQRFWHLRWGRQIPGVIVEGRLGPVLTVVAPANLAVELAALPDVSTVRLPRVARSAILARPDGAAEEFDALKGTGLDKMHKFKRQGQGIRVAVIDGDFRGWQRFLGKGLPKETKLVDLTRLRSPVLQPEPFPAPAEGLGGGTLCALAAVKAAPEIDLTLIRVDPAAPHLLLTAARYINGEDFRPELFARRDADLRERQFLIDTRREQLLEERRLVLEAGNDAESVKRREEYFKRQAEFDQEEKAYKELVRSFLALTQELQGLKSIRVVACNLIWTDGHPVDGSGALSRYFDDKPFKVALWLQAAGNSRGQAWTGLFRDNDGNEVMEFAAPETPLPRGAWTHELNFLAWEPSKGARTSTLPENVRVRVTLQWREPHDPDLNRDGDDLFREPLAPLNLLVVRQPDPAGAKQPSDDLVVVGETYGVPQRLDNTRNSAVYEHVLEFTASAGGRYAVRIEGRVPETTRPRGAPTLPGLAPFGELKPRVFVETLSGDGRVVLDTYTTETACLGMPADANRVIAVGAADAKGKSRGYSANGTAFNVELRPKPDLFAYDDLALEVEPRPAGSGLATGFAAGILATGLPMRCGVELMRDELQRLPRTLLRVPPHWLDDRNR
jgi:hypothetical protein